MFKKSLMMAFVAGALVMSGCASDSKTAAAGAAGGAGGADVFGKEIYLRGEITEANPWAPLP